MVTLSTRSQAFLSGYGLGLGGAILALILSGVGIVTLGLLGLVGLDVGISGRVLVLFVFGQYLPFVGFPLVYFRYRRGMSWSEIREYLGVRVPSLLEVGLILGGLVSLFLLVSGTAYFVTEILGLTPANNNAGEVAQTNPGIVPLFVVGSLLVIGPCEETLFRGTVQNRIREALSAPAAITLSAVLFASIHVTALTGGLGARATTIVILLVPSFVFGAIYEYSENLVVPALIHGLWNAMLFASIWVTMQADLPTGASVFLPL
jgi:membrane protease YdiL (CAAX protease family)